MPAVSRLILCILHMKTTPTHKKTAWQTPDGHSLVQDASDGGIAVYILVGQLLAELVLEVAFTLLLLYDMYHQDDHHCYQNDQRADVPETKPECSVEILVHAAFPPLLIKYIPLEKPHILGALPAASSKF